MSDNDRMRIDKWLWVARFFKTRSLAATVIASHKIRCNGEHVKPARDLKVGDELEITIGQLSHTLLGLAILLLSVPAASSEQLGRVVGIADGDTLTLLDVSRQQHKVRLASIDAPEAHQPFSQKSKTSLSALAFNKEVVVECPKNHF